MRMYCFWLLQNHKYRDRVLVQIGMQVIDQLVITITEKEVQKAGETWKQVHLGTIVLKKNTIKDLNIPENDFEGVKGKICTMKEVKIPPFETTVVKGMVNLITHSKCLSVVVKPVVGYSEHIATARSYGVLRPGEGEIDVYLRNHSAKQVILPKWTAVGQQKPTEYRIEEKEPIKGKKKTESQKEILDQIDLTGLEEWGGNEQEEARELITEYASIFAMTDMDLGKTSLVKRSIRLTDNTPFKECYQQIPPSMYEEVRKHLKEMVKIGAIWPPHNPWASLVVLVHKKDGKFWFCIDLKKLNAHTMKDSYSLPRIKGTLDSLNGDVWFTALYFKSGYWQVKMDEVSKPLTAFTVGLLGFTNVIRCTLGWWMPQLHSRGWLRLV